MDFKETKGLNNWIKSFSNGKNDESDLRQLWSLTEGYQQAYHPDAAEGFEKLSRRMNASSGAVIRPLRSRRRVLQIAATLALLVVASAVLFMFNSNPRIAFEKITTPASTTKNLQLEDGTSVALNGSSSLSFPTAFPTEKRMVKLSGEAFFKVAKEANRPFVVSSQHLDIEILGTSFNARDLDTDHLVEVFVKSGKVAVTVKARNERYTLAPGQKLVFNQQTGEVAITQDNSENPLAWKTRVLKFKDAPLHEIFAQMERLFAVEIITPNKEMLTCAYTTTVRAADLEAALQALETSCNLQIKALSATRYAVQGECAQ